MRKVQPGVKVVVALSLAAQEKASLAARTRARQGPAVKASQSADAMIDRGDGVLEKVSSGLQWTQRDNASDVTWDAAHQYWGALQTSGGGWRLPSEPEFRGLYIDTAGVAKPVPCGTTPALHPRFTYRAGGSGHQSGTIPGRPGFSCSMSTAA